MEKIKVATKKPLSLDFNILNKICDRAFFMALEMIHIANNRPVKDKGEPKVGGHPTACASSQHILTAIHMVMRKPEDYIACKPHVSPMDHALNFLLHNFRHADGKLFELEERKTAMRHLRHYSREGEPVFQSYHAEADPDSYRFYPSGSVGIPPVNALYTALGYEYAKDHGFKLDEDPYFWCLMGDSEFREGSLMEAMPDAGDRGLKKLIWIVDYNRQNLDGTRIVNEEMLGGSDADRIVRVAEANGWKSKKLKHGKLREKLFKSEGGEEFQRVLDEEFTDFEFQALLASRDPKLVYKRLSEKSDKLKKWMKQHSEETIYEAYFNLAGHDLECLIEAFQWAQTNKHPTLLVPYTIKGYRLESQALSGNHSAMPEEEEMIQMAKRLGLSHEDPFTDFPDSSPEEKYLKARRSEILPGIQKCLDQAAERRESWKKIGQEISWPVDFEVGALKFNPVAHTQWMWGQIAAKLDRLGRGDTDNAKLSPTDTEWKKVAKLFLTMAPDVGSSTNTSPNMSGKLYGDIGQQDFEALYHAKDQKAPDIVPQLSAKSGHLRFEIAEGNCMSAAGSFGKFAYFTGIPFYPAMTIYDFFIKRAHDQFYYNLYWHSTFATIGTPSGITLAPEGAQHSWKSDFQIPNCVTWEPCFAKELEWILADTLRRHFSFDNVARESALIRCVTKGLVQKELTDRLKRHHRAKINPPEILRLEDEKNYDSQPENTLLEWARVGTLEGGYALIDYRGYEGYTPGDNVIHIFAMGALVAEAIKASDLLLEKGIFANVFIVTSTDLLLGNFAYDNGYKHLKESLGITNDWYFLPGKNGSMENLGDWYSVRSAQVPVLSVHDGEPGLLDNIGAIVGVKQKAMAIRKTSKSGTTEDIFYYHHLDAASLEKEAVSLLEESAQMDLRLSRGLLEKLSERENLSSDIPQGVGVKLLN